MEKLQRDGRVLAAIVVWGAELERSGDRLARSLTPGLNSRDILMLASLVQDHEGHALPSELIGPIFTTAPGVSGSLDRLAAAGMVTRSRGDDLRTRPVTLTKAAGALIEALVEPWQDFYEQSLGRLDETERAELYRLLVKGSGQWDGVWPVVADEG